MQFSVYFILDIDFMLCFFYSQDIVDPDMKTLVEKDKKIATDIVLLTEELKELSRKLGHNFGETVPVVVEKVSDFVCKKIS